METYDSDDESISSRNQFIDFRSKEAENFVDLLETHLPPQVSKWSVDEKGWVFELDHLIIDVKQPPLDPIQLEIRDYELPRIYVDPLRQTLRRILQTPLTSRNDMTTFALLLLQIVEEAVGWQTSWIVDVQKRALGLKVPGPQGINLLESHTPIDDLLTNDLGADLDTIDRSGEQLLGHSIKSILSTFPSNFRLIHAEPIFRQNLVRNFLARKDEIYQQLLQCSKRELRSCVPPHAIRFGGSEDKKEVLAEYLAQPKVTFHGTERWNIPSIVRHGLVVPGQKAGDKKVEIEKGASYGIGIYSTPDPAFALLYTSYEWEGLQKITKHSLPGLRVLVCATLMGRSLQVSREEARRTEKIADEKAHSHVSPNGLEYIVFSSSQILPCYVLHIDTGAKDFQEAYEKVPLKPGLNFKTWSKTKGRGMVAANELAIKEKEKREKERARQAALKWFPFGFGSATGTGFVIEAVAETDDDEEEFGEWQGDRWEVRDWELGGVFGDGENGNGNKGSWFDEYQTVRRVFD